MYGLLVRRRVRRVVHDAIVPLVGYSEARIGAQAVRTGDRHSLGFIASLATLIALDRHAHLGSALLGFIQTDIIASLSGEDPAAIGEEIAFLHAEGEARYLGGCQHASMFFGILRPLGLGPPLHGEGLAPLLQNADLLNAWERHFETDLNPGPRTQHDVGLERGHGHGRMDLP